MEEQTPHGFPLPHKDNIASSDVMRIRETIEKVDENLSQQEEACEKLQKNFDRHHFEQFLNLWSTPYDNNL
jgi:phosphohistidine phosphatase SixA